MKVPNKIAYPLIALAIGALALLYYFLFVQKPSPLSEKQMRLEYACFRFTDDIRETDVYCSDYELYKRDYKNRNLIEDRY